MTFELTPQTIITTGAVITAAVLQTLLTYGVLACLKGLKEQGCNGPVSEAINKIEKYLNKKAHGD